MSGVLEFLRGLDPDLGRTLFTKCVAILGGLRKQLPELSWGVCGRPKKSNWCFPPVKLNRSRTCPSL
jgi:hypothetical protein